jgi:exodeoxyribonuclease V beta subunit
MDGGTGQPLQVFDTPLARINLIEASAGTGKTRAITDLYVRVIVETAWQVPQILVVTFTKAATAELRDRVRTRLALARDAFLTGKTLDPFCQQLIERYPSRPEVIQRLERAIRRFDEVAISTIHGFCQRVLAEVAFESGRPFENELVPDDRELVQDIVDDFWRRNVYQASPLFCNLSSPLGTRRKHSAPSSDRTSGSHT